MARSGATLKTELLGMGLHSAESAAIEAWAEAFTKYFEDAISNAVPIVVAALRTPTTGPKDLMKAGMTGLSVTGPAAIQAGITAFWGALVTVPAIYFPAATLITPPPTLATIAADLLLVMPVNVAESASTDTAMGRIASGHPPVIMLGLHTLNLGGTATFPGPIVAPIL